MKPFSPKDPGEIVILGFDFTKLLGTGETLTEGTASWAVEDGDGNASTDTAMVGSASISGPVVKQAISGGTLGEVYNHRATVSTSAGQTLTLGNMQRIVKGGFNV